MSRYNEGEGYSLDDALREKGINPDDPNLEIIEKDDRGELKFYSDEEVSKRLAKKGIKNDENLLNLRNW